MDNSISNKKIQENFKEEYNIAKDMAITVLNNLENLVLLGCNGVNGKSSFMKDLDAKNYTTLYGLEEVNSKKILEENPFILETNNKSDLKKLDSFEIPYKLIDIHTLN
jgi:hypothetical protein|tara:strand:- start:3073 stop:3396 length:324 start_codon:yes stop_codon:yes gene_type:complete